ncbi:class I SAM-dependent methyltransferase [Streptosporangium lutulentum]|uniref:Methylase of polypeptide subunit release factors n=1 Tax=Streptosporangium lutulentum TaxID=1461250 RepID=A0ABT9Q9I9_9ACTN|nr:class I SAM-dependent methyltransferase [Streptosporangium lutulentum]MDP9843066.1 methylase of polypeptide subunit release factors [Streptosporangium lutulentum]
MVTSISRRHLSRILRAGKVTWQSTTTSKASNDPQFIRQDAAERGNRCLHPVAQRPRATEDQLRRQLNHPKLDQPITRPRLRDRPLARQIALDADAWTSEPAAVMTTLFDQLAPTWDAEHATNRLDALTDALERGGTLPTGICLEVGSGTGRHTAALAGAFEKVIAIDLAWQMASKQAVMSSVSLRNVPRIVAGRGGSTVVGVVVGRVGNRAPGGTF